jgi:hypothetical protein
LSNEPETTGITQLIAADSLRMRPNAIYAVFTLDQIAAAFAMDQLGQTVGKIVISVHNATRTR